jgi:hypothetical protein
VTETAGKPCWLCRRDIKDDDYVLWVLHDGRLVSVCSRCLDRLDRPEETMDMTVGEWEALPYAEGPA